MNREDDIRKLIENLNYYTKLYDEGHPAISDKEWDNMYFALSALENETGIYMENSPTQRVNYQVLNKLDKKEHSHPMLSLDKTKSLDEVRSFLGNKLGIAMAKMDGLTCSLTYHNGRLIGAETRGNGIIGEDILHNALVVKNIPKRIDRDGELVVDGEIICTYNNFENFSGEYKNPRNFASGSIRLLDSQECSKRNLSFIAWDAVEGLEEYNLLFSKLSELDALGFTVVPFLQVTSVETEVDIIKDVCANTYFYPIDGIVFKYDKVEEYEAAGRTDHHFKGGIAYKFYDEEYETTLEDIEWTMGRTGVLTPVAIYEDIDIDGTICNRASLHNISVMKELGIKHYHCKISVFKANQIIPQISQVIKDDSKEVIVYPYVCPICKKPTSIHKDNDSEVLYCDNPNCEGKLINRIDHFCGKKGLDIKGLSKATIEKLLDWGYIGDTQSIYELNLFRNEWIHKAGFGEKSVDKILEAIENSKNTTLDKVIAAAGIPEIGSSVAKDIAKKFDSWEDFRKAYDYLDINGIGDVMNDNLLNFNYDEIDYIVENYLNIEKNNVIINNENRLESLTFCITGKTHIYKNRDELKSVIEVNGGKTVGSVSKNVNYLINNDSTSTSAKNVKAKELGIEIITEEEFQKLLTL